MQQVVKLFVCPFCSFLTSESSPPPSGCLPDFRIFAEFATLSAFVFGRVKKIWNKSGIMGTGVEADIPISFQTSESSRRALLANTAQAQSQCAQTSRIFLIPSQKIQYRFHFLIVCILLSIYLFIYFSLFYSFVHLYCFCCIH